MSPAASSARDAAVATMRAEINHQVPVLRSALGASRSELLLLAELLNTDSESVSIGIGDSYVVGRLAAEALKRGSRRPLAVQADCVRAAHVKPGAVAFCQSVSG